jgi:UDP-N-acetylmuramoyl-tripeptide--D-alanyl-D-alanine ligase
MLYNLNDLINALEKDIVYIDLNYKFKISSVVFDSREIEDNSLFIAKKGEKVDGHSFIHEILINNNTVVVLAEYLPENVEQNSRIILVKNTIKAFVNLAIFSRNRIRGHVIGITGSLGKTSTKDATFHCLSKIGKSFCNLHSFNNYFGVLTTLANTPKDVEFAIYEMGMNTIGEMDIIRNFIKPEIAVILNVKPAHLGNFNSEEEIATEKSKVMDSSTKAVILNLDNKWFDLLKNTAEKHNIKNILTFGINEKANIIVGKHSVNGDKAEINYTIDGKTFECVMDNIDYNIVYNSAIILAIAKYLKLDINRILEGIKTIDTTRGRNNIEYIKHKNMDLTIINGSYNAVNPETFITGLNLMNNIFKIGNNRRKVCIFGDMLEIGNKTDEFHLSLNEYILNSEVNVLVTIGNSMKLLNNSLIKNNIKLYHFDNVDILIDEIDNILENEDLLFIKSSKGIKTFKVLNYLVENKMKIFI